MAQYYSPFFQSGLLQPDKTPTPSRTVTPMASSSKATAAPALHRPSASVATASSAGASSSKSLYFVFGKTGSLRAPGTRPPTQSTGADDQHPHRGGRHPAHASFLSMDNSEHGHRSMFSSILPSAASSNPPPLSIPQRKTGPPEPDSPPSPALSTQSTQSHLLRPLPSPVPSTRSLKPMSMAEGGPTRALSNGSSMYRRTNRSRALAALEGRADQRAPASHRLRPVPESRSFVPFDSEGEDDEEVSQGEDQDARFRRFVETTRAAALREKQERERARREAEEQERHERERTAIHRGFASYTPAAALPASAYPAPPPSAPPHSYNYNFIDLDDDTSNSSTRTRSDLSRSFASMSVGSPPLPHARVPLPAPSPAPSMLPPPPPSPAPSRVLPVHAPVPVRTASQQRPGWQNTAMHIASAA
ncbi:hypothetical protein AURDEDRAFT_183593 [Auricularia subglabra TFB-10046 SS5]|nr:hypothetical protein AURDEDRAFT_183593 [Auricularia subglabra TFB-10046 SS5]